MLSRRVNGEQRLASVNFDHGKELRKRSEITTQSTWERMTLIWRQHRIEFLGAGRVAARMAAWFAVNINRTRVRITNQYFTEIGRYAGTSRPRMEDVYSSAEMVFERGCWVSCALSFLNERQDWTAWKSERLEILGYREH